MSPSPTHTELAEIGYRAWNEDDLEALLAICHPEVQYRTSGVIPGLQSVYEGEAGIRRWWADFHEPWSQIKVIPERISARTSPSGSIRSQPPRLRSRSADWPDQTGRGSAAN